MKGSIIVASSQVDSDYGVHNVLWSFEVCKTITTVLVQPHGNGSWGVIAYSSMRALSGTLDPLQTCLCNCRNIIKVFDNMQWIGRGVLWWCLTPVRGSRSSDCIIIHLDDFVIIYRMVHLYIQYCRSQWFGFIIQTNLQANWWVTRDKVFLSTSLSCHIFVCYNIKYGKEVVHDCSNVCPTSRSVVLLENWETHPFL